LSEMVSVPVCVPELVGAEATLIAQLAPTAKEPPQLLVSTNCPETVTLLKVTLAVPVLRTVTVCEPLVCPTLTLPKLRLVGDTLTVVDPPEGETPDPVKLIVWGLFEALSVMVTVPVRVPVVVGAKSTLIAQLAPAATEDPQVPEPAKAKSPPMVRLLIVSVAFPVLLSVTACAALAVPTV